MTSKNTIKLSEPSGIEVLYRESENCKVNFSSESMACLFDDDNARQKALEHAVYNAYVKVLREPLWEVIRGKCYGCQIDHPSQNQHVCLLMTYDEQVDCFLEEALKRVNKNRLRKEWMAEIATVFPNQNISHILLNEIKWDMPDIDSKEGLMRLGSLMKQ